ncbi:InlB B-repeat-containing protein, partial [Candidatus Darwinibacter acetoxidans]
MNRFRHTVSVLSLVMVLLLLAGCLPKAGVTEYTLTVNVKPEGAAEVEGVAEKYEKNAVATFKLIANEGYEFVEWEGDVKPTETDDGQWQIIMDGDKTLTATFEVTEEEPDELEEAIAAAEAAIAALPEEITLDDAEAIAAARALVEAVFELDEEAEIEGIEKLEAAEAELARLQDEKAALAEAIAAAEAAIEALPEVITLEDADQVAEARALVNAVLAIDEDAEIEGIEKLEALEEALQTLGWNPVNEDLVADALKKANEGLDLKTAFEGEELDLPEELTVGAYSYVLIWTTDSPDVVEIEEGKAKITRPEETTTVTLTATLGYDISAQAETKPQSFDVQIKVWGLVSELKRLADAGTNKKFEELLEILVPDYDKNLVEEYMGAIADLLKLETKEELLQEIAAVNTDVLSAVNEAVAAYFAATTKSKQEKALADLRKAVTELGQKVKDWVGDDKDQYGNEEFDDEFIEENYLPALKGGVSTIEELQAIINQVNLDVAEKLVAKLEANPWVADTVRTGEATAFVNKILVEESQAAKEALRDRLDAVIAVNEVLNADEDNMATVLTAQSFENVKDLNKKYFAAILGDDGFEEGTRVTVADIQAVIDQVNAEYVSVLIGKVVAAAEAEPLDTGALNNALTNLKTFVGATVWSDDAASISSEEENLKQYGEAIKEQQPTTV